MHLSLRSIRWAIYGALLWMAFAPLARLRGQSFQWVTIAGSTRDEIAQFMTVDLAGNTYLTGHIGGSTSFGNTTLVATEAELMFLAKFNAMGQPVWAIQAQGNSNSEGRAVAVDRNGNVFVTGYFTGATRFEATELLSRGLGDLFVAKYDSSGHLLWVRQAGGDDASSPEFSRAIAVDFRGHCYVFAEFRGTVDVGAFRLTASNGLTSFLAKYDTDGNVLWARTIAPCSYDDRRGIAFDPWGNIVLAANFRGAVSFGDQTLASAGAGDVLLAKLDPSGNFLWARQAGGEDSHVTDNGSFAAVDGAGNIFVTGYFHGTARFGSSTVTSAGANDLFLASYTRDGELRWVRSAGGSSADAGNGIALDGSGGVLVTGFYFGEARFDQTVLSTGSHADLVVAKFDGSGRQLWVLPAGGTAYCNGNSIGVSSAGTIFVAGYVRGASRFGTIETPGYALREIFVARVAEPAPPRLNVSRSDNQTLVSWPSAFPGFQLQTKTNFDSAAAWLDLANPVPNAAGRMIFTNTLPGAERFFRLIKP